MANGENPPPIKLDLSYGNLPDGHPFIRVPKLNPSKFPWPLKDNSVEEVCCAFMLNRIPGSLHYQFMDELYRVLIPQGKALIIVPYWSSPRAIQDSGSAWPPFCDQSFYYFNKGWREAQKDGAENACKCDFDIVCGYALDQETANRNDETRPFWFKHYLNAINDLHVTLTKK